MLNAVDAISVHLRQFSRLMEVVFCLMEVGILSVVRRTVAQSRSSFCASLWCRFEELHKGFSDYKFLQFD